MKTLVIADDFTGANDAGVQFCKQRAIVDVVFGETVCHPTESDVLVINTDSRALLPEQAQQRIATVFDLLSNQCNFDYIYKKTDSTLRGNIGAELETIMDHTKSSVTLFCPAFPQVARTIKHGICYISDNPLLDTEFATDPKTPVVSSKVSTILAQQTTLPIIEIHFEALRNGKAEDLIYAAQAQYQRCIVSFDALVENDLYLIAALVKQIKSHCIFAGSSGLAAVLAKKWYSMETNIKPLFCVAGSMSEITQQQIDQARPLFEQVTLNTELLLQTSEQHQPVIEQLVAQLQQNHNLIIQTDNSTAARQNIAALCAAYSLTRVQLGERICSALSSIAIEILHRIEYQISGLFLTGGDIAIGVASELNAKSYRIGGEIETGVPFGYFPNTALSSIPVITKAGGFGSQTVLEKSLNFIQSLTNKEC